MRHPFAHYAALASTAEPSSARWLWLRGPLLWLLMLGAFVSLTASGRLVWYHVLLPMTSWAFMPIFQVLWVSLLARNNPRGLSAARRVDLYFVGQGPNYLIMLFFIAMCLFTPHTRLAFYAIAFTGILPIVLTVLFSWSAMLTYAFFRSACGYSRRAAWARSLGFLVLYAGGILAYFELAGGQLSALAS